MKKAQILSAIALAFALGVVIPVATASAVTQQGDATLTTNSQKAADDEVKAVKQSFTTIKTVDLDGDTDKEYTGAAAYGFIATHGHNLSNGLDFVENAEKAGGNVTVAFQQKVATYTFDGGSLKTELNSITKIGTLFNSSDDWTGADLATAKATVSEIISLIDDAAKEATVQTTKDNLIMIAHNLREVITDDEIQKLVDADIAAADAAGQNKFASLKDLYKMFTGEEAGTITTEAKLDKVTAAVKNGFGSANWSKYLRVNKLITKIENGIKNHDATDPQLDTWTAQLKAAAGASGDTTVIPEGSDTDSSIKPGNTGALNSAAEGTASTTVSIVAGLATALTALGAGVVAYRNARRN